MDEILDKYIPTYFDTSDAADKIGEKLQSKNYLIAGIGAFIE